MELETIFEAILGDLVDVKGRLMPGLVLVANLFLAIRCWGTDTEKKVLSEAAKNHRFTVFTCIILGAWILGGANLYLSFRVLTKIWEKPHPVQFYSGSAYDNDEGREIIKFFKDRFGDPKANDFNLFGDTAGKKIFDLCKEQLAHKDKTSKARVSQLEARVNFHAGLAFPLILTALYSILYLWRQRSKVGWILAILLSIVCIVNILQFARAITFSEPKSIYSAYYAEFSASANPQKKNGT